MLFLRCAVFFDNQNENNLSIFINKLCLFLMYFFVRLFEGFPFLFLLILIIS